jgi:hypothetical protein
MLQVFHLNVAKVDLDVAYTCMLQACFPGVSDVRYKCFIWILHMFCNDYNCVFLVFHTYVASVLTVSNICCEVFHLDVAKLDLVLHML